MALPCTCPNSDTSAVHERLKSCLFPLFLPQTTRAERYQLRGIDVDQVAEIVAQITGIAGVARRELGRDGQSQVPDLSSASLRWTK